MHVSDRQVTSAFGLSRCDDIIKFLIFKIKFRLRGSMWLLCIRVMFKGSRLFSTQNVYILPLYQDVFSSLAVEFWTFTSTYFIYTWQRLCIATSACLVQQQFSSGEATYPLGSHLRVVSSPVTVVRGSGPVSDQPRQLRNIREMCDPCAEVARDTCFNIKGGSFHLLWCVKWAIRGIPSDFDCGTWLTEHRYETSFPVAADPDEEEPLLRKGLTWITDPFVGLNRHYFIYFRLMTKTFLLDYTVPFCPLLEASKVNVL